MIKIVELESVLLEILLVVKLNYSGNFIECPRRRCSRWHTDSVEPIAALEKAQPQAYKAFKTMLVFLKTTIKTCAGH